jgi:hypothetical protein
LKNTPKYLNGYRVQLRFTITLHKKDLALLNSIKAFFGVGKIYNLTGRVDYIIYQVTTCDELQVLIDRFDNYPFITQKRADYELFKQAFELVSRKEHLTLSGLHSLVAALSKESPPLSLKEREGGEERAASPPLIY